jgi:WhiB family redox-sensing transcriptional regulator
MLKDRDFIKDAACRNVKGIDFHSDSMREMKRAIKICMSCPVQEDCLSYAMDNAIYHGVWGGMTARQRQILAGRKITR